MKTSLGTDKQARTINLTYAGMQGSYWASYCTISGYTLAYLSYLGMSDSQVGYTNSLAYLFSILLQLILSDFSDKHENAALKKIIALLMIAAIAISAALSLLPIPMGMVMIVYAVRSSCATSVSSLGNAMMMQLINIGLPVTYGWPRGVGSLTYSIMAVIIGLALEKYSAGILIPVFMILAAISALITMLMPTPQKILRDLNINPSASREKKGSEGNSYLGMIRNNRTLRLFLLTLIVSAIGHSIGVTFLMRVTDRLGASSFQFGVAQFMQAGIELPMMILSGHIMRRWRADQLAVLSFFAFGVKILLLTVAENMTVVYIAMLLSAFCYGLLGFTSVYFVNEITGPGEKTRAQSLVSLCYTGGIGGIIGNSLGGVLVDTAGIKASLGISSAAAFGGAIIMVLCSRAYRQQAKARAAGPVEKQAILIPGDKR